MTDADPILPGFALVLTGPPNADGPKSLAAFNLTIMAAADMVRRILERPAQRLLAAPIDVYGLGIISVEPGGATRVMARVISPITADALNSAFEEMARAERGAAA